MAKRRVLTEPQNDDRQWGHSPTIRRAAEEQCESVSRWNWQRFLAGMALIDKGSYLKLNGSGTNSGGERGGRPSGRYRRGDCEGRATQSLRLYTPPLMDA